MLPLFSLTIFLGAALLFLVEPMVARMALPKLGGSPAVWNTCMVFFQAALLAGYALAHWSLAWMGPRRQAALQVALVLTPALVLPVAVRGLPGPGASPAAWLLAALAAGVGLPFLIVATGGPVLQRWFAATGHRSGRDPYFLYAAGNAGSLLALLAYPVVLEPRWGLAEQARAWTWGYGAFAALTIACALAVWFGGKAGEPRAEAQRTQGENAEQAEERIGIGRRLSWVALAFIPSTLTLGVTQFLSTDIAAVPLLWVVPLAIYLLTFVFAFASKPIPTWIPARALPMAAVGLAIAFLIDAKRPAWVLVTMHLATLFLCALLCHTRLAASRPRASRLTEFYLLVAVGGVLGGVFNALLAPVLFNQVLEYPIALVLALLVRPRVRSRFDRLPRPLLHLADFAAPVMIGGLALALDDLVRPTLIESVASPDKEEGLRLAVTIGIPAMLCYLVSPRPRGFALGIAAMLSLAMLVPNKDGVLLTRERTFFGVYKVSQRDLFTTLTHGTTVHGLQYRATEPAFRKIPLGYYHPDGPIGAVFRVYGAAAGRDGRPLLEHVGLVGMGTGALAAYPQPKRLTFHEIDPEVVAIASDPRYFSYLADSTAQWDVALGDGRLTVGAVPDGEYGLIVLDAFSSDAVPVHLLTREALETYLKKLRPGGLLAFHISNHFVDLEPVLAREAKDLGLTALVRTDDIDEKTAHEKGRFPCVWAVLARDASDLTPLGKDARWLPAQTKPGVQSWTDDFSNIWTVFQWN